MRYPEIKYQDMNHRQREAVAIVKARRKPSVSSEGGVEGPFIPLVYIPEVLDKFQALGEHCRFHTSVPPKLRELAIIITARHVSAQLEFHVHAMEAREFGLAEPVIQAIAQNKQPEFHDQDERIVYEFCSSLHANGQVPEDVFAQAEKAFGQAMLIELITTCGYYGTLGLSMNVSHAPTPNFLKGFPAPFPAVPQ